MAAGRPVVATNIDGFAGVITHGVEGLLVRPKTAMRWPRRCSSWSKTPTCAARWASKASERAQHFSWDRVSQRVLSYYERLAFEKGVTSPWMSPKSVEA